jgi:hypothetical protein
MLIKFSKRTLKGRHKQRCGCDGPWLLRSITSAFWRDKANRILKNLAMLLLLELGPVMYSHDFQFLVLVSGWHPGQPAPSFHFHPGHIRKMMYCWQGKLNMMESKLPASPHFNFFIPVVTVTLLESEKRNIKQFSLLCNQLRAHLGFLNFQSLFQKDHSRSRLSSFLILSDQDLYSRNKSPHRNKTEP